MSRILNRYSSSIIYALIICGLAITVPYPVLGHIENYLLPEGCGSCHVGHGMAQQPMLEKSEEEFCYQCHGSNDKQSLMKTRGKLSPVANLKDIEEVFRKPYRHPVAEGMGHSSAEVLPSPDKSTVTHAECVDCHNPHQKIRRTPPRVDDVPGYSISGQHVESSRYEYEICLKCHSNMMGSGTTKDIKRDFSVNNVSQHPVTRNRTMTKVISLNLSMSFSAMMKCSDCHTNDDPSGPQGPHGSNYPLLLSGNYNTNVEADESPYAYEFCYSCHNRSSILGNESFPLHREHIIGDPVRQIKGTSCRTCHASHSSKDYPHLLDFNPEAVSRDSRTGRIFYNQTGDRSGECYLSCHGKGHSPAKY